MSLTKHFTQLKEAKITEDEKVDERNKVVKNVQYILDSFIDESDRLEKYIYINSWYQWWTLPSDITNRLSLKDEIAHCYRSISVKNGYVSIPEIINLVREQFSQQSLKIIKISVKDESFHSKLLDVWFTLN